MWFESKVYEELKEQYEDETLHDCLSEHSLKEYLDDFINLNITKDNYLKLIELCDFLMIEDSDILVNKIVQCFGISIIHNFGDFYKYNCKHLHIHNKTSLREAIQLYCQNKKKCYKTYGFSAYWNVSNITNMNNMFMGTLFNGDISQWNVSKVTTMEYMFAYCYQFNGDLSQWDVSNVRNMRGMFNQVQFNGDLSKWNVSNVINMYSMFYISKFSGDLSQWDVSNVMTMDYMFAHSEFNGNISKWDVSNVETMNYMFYKTKFNGNISKWDVSNVKTMKNMFA